LNYLIALVVGTLYAAGIYMMLRRSMLKVILGIVLLSQGANVLIFSTTGLRRGAVPIVEGDEIRTVASTADPLPQALILTAIVISFGVTAYSLVLVARTYEGSQSDDLDEPQLMED
jgi:multicomponent Na+:H+ antiporter subunit C